MQLDNSAVDEFKEIFFKEYGVRLTDVQAIESGIRLIRLVKAVYGNNLPKLNVRKETCYDK